MNRAVRKIPKHYLNEFLKQQTTLIKRQTELATILFVFTFCTGSIINSLALNTGFSPQLILTWILAVTVFTAMFAISIKISSIQQAKLIAALFMIMCLAVSARYYVAIDGVIEAKVAGGREYGAERLEDFTRKNNDLRAGRTFQSEVIR